MTIKELTISDITTIYQTHMVKDFPKDELKPLSAIYNLLEKQLYVGYGLYEDNELCAYGLIAYAPSHQYALLDYLAVLSNKRGQGYGSTFLNLLSSIITDHQGLMIEIENPDFAIDEEDLLIRQKRRRFYLNNGLIETQVKSCCFGVHFNILLLPFKALASDEVIYKELDDTYKAIFPKAAYNTSITMSLN